MIRQRACNGDPLFLASTEGGWISVPEVVESEPSEDRPDPVFVAVARVFLWQAGVLPGRQVRDEPEVLEDDADLLAAQSCPLAFTEVRDVRPVERQSAIGERFEETQDVKERRLARTARTLDEDRLSLPD